MSFGRSYPPQGDILTDNRWQSNPRDRGNPYKYENINYYNNYDDYYRYYDGIRSNISYMNYLTNYQDSFRDYREQLYDVNQTELPRSSSFKRRKISESDMNNDLRNYYQTSLYGYAPGSYSVNKLMPAATGAATNSQACSTSKRDRSHLEDDSDAVFMSREEIERCSPSRKDGIDALQEAHLRYSYCSFIQNLGMRLQLPQTITGTAMVLCHRFFVRRSHVSHDRYLIATAALFLAAKSEETARPLNNVLQASCEILHKQDFTILSYMLPIGWFEQYRERVTVAEQLILTTLNFELEVQHPYDPLNTILQKLGLSRSVLVNLALNLVSEGICARLDDRLFDFLAV